MPSRLDDFLNAKEQELPELEARYPRWQLELMLLQASNYEPHFWMHALKASLPTINLIGEIKPASPSQGTLQTDSQSLEAILSIYNEHVNAVSVLTEPQYFQGSPELFQQLRQQTSLPMLWKDFIISPYQLLLAKALGANAALLIVKALDFTDLKKLYEQSLQYAITPVVEIQAESELELALRLQPSVILINNRDLNTLHTDLTCTEQLAPFVPKNTLCISASGIKTTQDIQRLSPYANTFLVGTSLMEKSLDSLAEQLNQLKTASSFA